MAIIPGIFKKNHTLPDDFRSFDSHDFENILDMEMGQVRCEGSPCNRHLWRMGTEHNTSRAFRVGSGQIACPSFIISPVQPNELRVSLDVVMLSNQFNEPRTLAVVLTAGLQQSFCSGCILDAHHSPDFALPITTKPQESKQLHTDTMGVCVAQNRAALLPSFF